MIFVKLAGNMFGQLSTPQEKYKFDFGEVMWYYSIYLIKANYTNTPSLPFVHVIKYAYYMQTGPFYYYTPFDTDILESKHKNI